MILKEENKKRAYEWFNFMESYANAEYTPYSVSNSAIVNDSNVQYSERPLKTPPIVEIQNQDTVSAIFEASKDKNYNNTIIALNFASYKNPGGMFLEGSTAQEESLCMESNLYNILRQFDTVYYDWNRGHLNNGLYMNRAILTPAVLFKRGEDEVLADVLTCAAPNRSNIRFGKFTEEDNLKALESRIKFISEIILRYAPDHSTIILGAYGCGVFKQNPHNVASLFFKHLVQNVSMMNYKIVFAIPGMKLAKNYSEFDTLVKTWNSFKLCPPMEGNNYDINN